jgi:hypothetical protein
MPRPTKPPSVVLFARVTPKLAHQVRAHCVVHRITQAQLIARLLKQEIAKDPTLAALTAGDAEPMSKTG